MKKVLLSSLLVGSLSVAAIAPTFASVPTDMTIKQMTTGHGVATTTTRTNNMNGNGVDPFYNNGNRTDLNPFNNNGTGTRIGNDVRNGINDVGRGINDVGNDVGRGINDVGNDVRRGFNRTFGTNGTNNGYGTYDRNRTNNYRGMSVNSNGMRTNNYRAAAADNDDGFDWGWLGLLGLIGLAGMRGRSREEAR